MAKPKKLVIFDLDNTLVITRPAAKIAYKQAIAYIAKRHGLEHQAHKLYHHWKRLVQKVMGERKPQMRRFEYSLSLLLSEHKLPETHFAAALHTYERELLKHLEPQNGAKELLSWLHDQGHLVAVATASERSEATKKLKHAELYQFIDILVTANETATMKPDPSYYRLVIKEASTNADNVIVVGDSDAEDLAPAKKLNLKTVKITPNQFHLGTLKAKLESLMK